jgi:hypothetical protein
VIIIKPFSGKKLMLHGKNVEGKQECIDKEGTECIKQRDKALR